MRFPDSSSTKTVEVPMSASVSRQEISHKSDLGVLHDQVRAILRCLKSACTIAA